MAVKKEVVKSRTIQEQEMPNGTLPYGFIVDAKGNVGRQDFWKGHPAKVIGFSKTAAAGSIDLFFAQFWKNPELAIGMHLVVADNKDEWGTRILRVESVR